ncbi:hypothetical protein F5Y06DRAFT_148650 [Hypoxylon sp. FL0890]|nr:hypothetical protein F5Y06DRAFT_148650 [Hypoxylon sp. FL0890]
MVLALSLLATLGLFALGSGDGLGVPNPVAGTLAAVWTVRGRLLGRQAGSISAPNDTLVYTDLYQWATYIETSCSQWFALLPGICRIVSQRGGRFCRPIGTAHVVVLYDYMHMAEWDWDGSLTCVRLFR